MTGLVSTEPQLVNSYQEAVMVKTVDLSFPLLPLSLATPPSPIVSKRGSSKFLTRKVTAVLFMGAGREWQELKRKVLLKS